MAQTHMDVDSTLKTEQERLNARRQELEAQIPEIDQRLRRISAYFGEGSPSTRSPRSAQGTRHPRGFVQETVLKTISDQREGMTSAEITKALGTQGIGQQSIANALSALTQANKIKSEGRGGKYRATS